MYPSHRCQSFKTSRSGMLQKKLSKNTLWFLCSMSSQRRITSSAMPNELTRSHLAQPWYTSNLYIFHISIHTFPPSLTLSLPRVWAILECFVWWREGFWREWFTHQLNEILQVCCCLESFLKCTQHWSYFEEHVSVCWLASRIIDKMEVINQRRRSILTRLVHLCPRVWNVPHNHVDSKRNLHFFSSQPYFLTLSGEHTSWCCALWHQWDLK